MRYRLPLGILGTVVHALRVRRDVERIFDYRRLWVPESQRSTAPNPIVDHNQARDRALEALASIRKR